MKAIIKKVCDYIQAKIDKYVIKRFEQLMPKELITALYRRVVERDLEITHKIIDVKKGKVRYKLLIIKNRKLEMVYNLGRHFEQEPKLKTI